MAAPRVVRSIFDFLAGVLQRDRYLTEVLAAAVTFGVGILASFSQEALGSRPSLAGLRDMPGAEFYVIAFSLPGIWSALQLWWDGERHGGQTSLAVMISFVALSVFSYAMDLNNWAFWTLFALQLGVLKGLRADPGMVLPALERFRPGQLFLDQPDPLHRDQYAWPHAFGHCALCRVRSCQSAVGLARAGEAECLNGLAWNSGATHGAPRSPPVWSG